MEETKCPHCSATGIENLNEHIKSHNNPAADTSQSPSKNADVKEENDPKSSQNNTDLREENVIVAEVNLQSDAIKSVGNKQDVIRRSDRIAEKKNRPKQPTVDKEPNFKQQNQKSAIATGAIPKRSSKATITKKLNVIPNSKASSSQVSSTPVNRTTKGLLLNQPVKPLSINKSQKPVGGNPRSAMPETISNLTSIVPSNIDSRRSVQAGRGASKTVLTRPFVVSTTSNSAGTSLNTSVLSKTSNPTERLVRLNVRKMSDSATKTDFYEVVGPTSQPFPFISTSDPSPKSSCRTAANATSLCLTKPKLSAVPSTAFRRLVPIPTSNADVRKTSQIIVAPSSYLERKKNQTSDPPLKGRPVGNVTSKTVEKSTKNAITNTTSKLDARSASNTAARPNHNSVATTTSTQTARGASKAGATKERKPSQERKSRCPDNYKRSSASNETSSAVNSNTCSVGERFSGSSANSASREDTIPILYNDGTIRQQTLVDFDFTSSSSEPNEEQEEDENYVTPRRSRSGLTQKGKINNPVVGNVTGVENDPESKSDNCGNDEVNDYKWINQKVDIDNRIHEEVDKDNLEDVESDKD